MTKRREPRNIDGLERWRCTRCGLWFPRDSFYTDTRQTAGIKSECRPCHIRTSIASRDPERVRHASRAWQRTSGYAQRPTTKERERERSRLRRKTVEHWARMALDAAIRIGIVIRPNVCPRCGVRADVQGHHTDYLRPINVEWLCTQCHADEHRSLRGAGDAP